MERDDGEIDHEGLLLEADVQGCKIDRRLRTLLAILVLGEVDGQAVGKARIELKQRKTTLQ